LRTCSDHEPAAFPGNLLFNGKGCVTEVVAKGLRGFLFPVAHLASINHDVKFVGDSVDSDRAELECFDAHGTVVLPTSLGLCLWQDVYVATVARRSEKGALVALIGVSLVGTVDVAEFLATRSSMFTDAPGRAAGSVVGLVAWAALLAVATLRYAGGERRGARAATIGLAGLVAVGNVGLAAIHLKAGVAGVRPIVGGVLGVLALLLARAPALPSPRGGGE
jgi:hypothetical protein